MTDLLADLRWRGLIAQTTDEEALSKALVTGPITMYCGFDPTAQSLHIGNLVQILTLRRFQLAGHQPIALVGGATGLVGDPSGRSAERTLNDTETVELWVARIRQQLERFLDFSDGPSGARMANNLDWIVGVSALELLRDIGKHFSVNQMLAKESVSARLGAGGISYTEFSYQVLQAFDYLQLYRAHGCVLQIGGSDQWGNITAGLDLIRRAAQGSAHALTTPLLAKADGTKFGKTATGTIWLDPTLTSPYALYQYWFGSDDRDVISFLKVFTFLSHEEIDALELAMGERPAAREAQRRLAQEVTTLVHGERECQQAEAAAKALFGQGELGELDVATLAAAAAEIPQTVIAQMSESGTLADLMAMTGIVESKSAARRAIREGGAYLNNAKVSDENYTPVASDFLAGRFLFLRRGKRELGAVLIEQ